MNILVNSNHKNNNPAWKHPKYPDFARLIVFICLLFWQKLKAKNFENSKQNDASLPSKKTNSAAFLKKHYIFKGKKYA